MDGSVPPEPLYTGSNILETMKKKCTKYHADGSLWAKGAMDGKFMEGYWE